MITTGPPISPRKKEVAEVFLELEKRTLKACIRNNKKLRKKHDYNEEIVKALKKRERRNQEELKNTQELLQNLSNFQGSP